MTTGDLFRYPSWTWSDDEKSAAQQRRAELWSEMVSLADRAESEDRNLTDDESDRYQQLRGEYDQLALS